MSTRPTNGETVEVFNLTIEGAESNYFAVGILVHNKSVDRMGPQQDAVADVMSADQATVDVSADVQADVTPADAAIEDVTATDVIPGDAAAGD